MRAFGLYPWWAFCVSPLLPSRDQQKMKFLKGILNRDPKGRILGQKAPYSISTDQCHLKWMESPLLEKAAKLKIPTLDKAIILPQSNELKSGAFLRIFVLKPEEVGDQFTTFDFTSDKIKDLNSETLVVGENSLSASRISAVEVNDLKDNAYHENFLVKANGFHLLFELHLGNNDDPMKAQIVEDYVTIVNSLKTKVG